NSIDINTYPTRRSSDLAQRRKQKAESGKLKTTSRSHVASKSERDRSLGRSVGGLTVRLRRYTDVPIACVRAAGRDVPRSSSCRTDRKSTRLNSSHQIIS